MTDLPLIARLVELRLLEASHVASLRHELAGLTLPRDQYRRLADLGLLTAAQCEELTAGREPSFGGRFVLLEERKSGGLATVFSGRQVGPLRPIVVKQWLRERVGDQERWDELLDAVRQVARTVDPGLATVLDLDLDDVRLAVAFEELPAGTAAGRLKSGELLAPQTVGEIALALLRTLRTLHGRRLVHGDLKPTVVVPSIAADGTLNWCKLLNAGTGRISRRAVVEALQRNPAAAGKNSEIYCLAPEQLDNPDRFDAGTDRYALGWLIFHLLTGEQPFAGANPLRRAVAQMNSTPPAVRTLRPEASAAWDGLFRRWLAADPEQRHESWDELREALREVLAPAPVGRSAGASNASATDDADLGLLATLGSGVGSALGSGLSLGMGSSLGTSSAAAPASSKISLDKGSSAPSKSRSQTPAPAPAPAAAEEELTLAPTTDERGRPLNPPAPAPLQPPAPSLQPSTTPAYGLAPSPGQAPAYAPAPASAPAYAAAPAAVPGRSAASEFGDVHSLGSAKGWEGPGRCVTIAPSTKFALVGGNKGAYLWDLERGKAIRAVPHAKGGIGTVLFPPGNGRTVFVGGDDGTIAGWDLQAGKLQCTLTGHAGPVHCLAASPDGQWLASGGEDSTIHLWSISGAQVVKILQHTEPVRTLCFSADGNYLLLGGGSRSDFSIRYWNWSLAEELRNFAGHTAPVRAALLSADGLGAISVSDDATVRLWDMRTGVPVAALTGHVGPVRAVTLSADARLALSGGDDFQVRVWDLARLGPAGVLTGHTGAVRGLGWALNRERIVSVGDDETLRIWPRSATLPPA